MHSDFDEEFPQLCNWPVFGQVEPVVNSHEVTNDPPKVNESLQVSIGCKAGSILRWEGHERGEKGHVDKSHVQLEGKVMFELNR